MNSEQSQLGEHEFMPEGVEAAPPLTHTMAIIRWCILGGMALFACVMVLGFFGLTPFAQTGSGQATQYHCPMHPTYISNQPGDCPICGMSLVAIGDDSASMDMEKSEVTDRDSGTNARPGQYICPMHPEIVSDTAGRCPKCKMFLEQVPPDTSAATVKIAKPGQYSCPMCPEIISDAPGECSNCGMDLELVTDTAPSSGGHTMHMTDTSTVSGLVPVTIEPKRLKLIGLQTAMAERTSIGPSKRLTGFVTVDETKLVHIHLRAGGWVTKALVVETGATVKEGDPLLVMYSQELFAASQEYILARKALARASADTAALRVKRELVEASRYRLLFFGLQPDDIASMDSTNVPLAELIVRSPVNGYIYEKAVNDGQWAGADATLYSIADRNAVWLIAEAYEPDLAGVRVGQPASVTTASGGEPIEARVAYIYPAVSEKTRTGKIRLEISRGARELRPGMYATVNITQPDIMAVTIPADAVLDGGETQYVFVVHDSTHFVPRTIKIGKRGGDRVEILAGISVGESVVTNANFLIDSESRIKAAISGMSSTPQSEHQH